MARPILSSLVIFITVTFHANINLDMSAKVMAIAQLLVTPMWNTSSDNPSCTLERMSEDVVIFNGDRRQFCRMVVNASHDDVISLIITNTTIEDDFMLIAERLGPYPTCLSKYTVLKDSPGTDSWQSCNVMLNHAEVLLDLRGDINVEVQKTSAVSEICHNPKDKIDLKQGDDDTIPISCSKTMDFEQKIVCYIHSDSTCLSGGLSSEIPVVCEYQFHSNCDSVVSLNSMIRYKCEHETNQVREALIIYEKEVNVLQFRYNNITDIEDGTFKGMNNLKCLNVAYNKIYRLTRGMLEGLGNLISLNTRNNRIDSLNEHVFRDMPKLEFIGLAENNLKVLPDGLLKNVNLKSLFFRYNKLESFSPKITKNSTNLELLALAYNRLTSLDDNLFRGLSKLFAIGLDNNLLTTLPLDLFRDTVNLALLYLSNNRLHTIPDIHHLHNLKMLYLEGNPLTNIHKGVFSKLPMTSAVIGSQHEICECFVDQDKICIPTTDRSPYLTCERLLSDRILMIMMWLIGINALFGNMIVLGFNLMKSSPNSVQDRLLSNLAMSDLLMGVYMLIIASADIYFGEHFPMNSEAWRLGIPCRITGAISLISSEASVFFITLISIDRFINIQFPYTKRKLGKYSALIVIALTWLLSLAFGTIPSALSGQNFKFYDNSHVCIGLPLALTPKYETENLENVVQYIGGLTVVTEDVDIKFLGNISGMYYAVALFLGLNGMCYLIILFCYAAILRAVRESFKRTGRAQEMTKQIHMTTKVIVIVGTDFCCWFPIIVLGVLVQLRLIELPPSVFAWCVTFVLPINSAINPYLYTIPALIAKFRKDRKMRKWSKDKKKAQVRSTAETTTTSM